MKKKVPNALCVQERKVLEEYSSDEEDESGIAPAARVAIATTPSASTSLFESPNENEARPYTCLMAKATSVTPYTKTFDSAPPTLVDCVENIVKEPKSPDEVDIWLANLRGVDNKHVDALIEQLEETNALADVKDEIISGMAAREIEYADEIAELSEIGRAHV